MSGISDIDAAFDFLSKNKIKDIGIFQCTSEYPTSLNKVGINLIEKRNIFGFKRIKFNKQSRLFNKSLAGGCILDLGCYPSSMSILIAKLKDPNNLEFELKNSKIEQSSTEVDIDSYTEINFSNGFKSSIGCSFKKNIGKSTKILGTKGSISIYDSWHCFPMKITVNKNDIVEVIGHPSSISKFNSNKWFYIERKQTNQSLFKLGIKKISKNNILVIEFNNKGLVKNKKLVNLNDMNDLKYVKKITTKEFEQDNTIYNIFSSLREKVNAPARNRTNKD